MHTSTFALLLAAAAVPAAAQDITDFGPVTDIGPITIPSTWSYDGASSLLSGPIDNGNILFGTFLTTMDFSQANQIHLRAEVTSQSAPVDSFVFTLHDQSGSTASAVFSWADYLGGGTHTRPLTPFITTHLQNVSYWSIRSVNTDGPFTLPFSIRLTEATATFNPVPQPSGSGPIITGFGANATATGAWSYDAQQSRISGTPGFGATLSGTLPYSSMRDVVGISLTASANVTGGAPFIFQILSGNDGAASAMFNWENFNGGTTTVISELVGRNWLVQDDLVQWRILSASGETPVDAQLFGASLVLASGLGNPIPEPGQAAPVLLLSAAGAVWWRRRSARRAA